MMWFWISNLGRVDGEHLEVNLHAPLEAPFFVPQEGVVLKLVNASIETTHALSGVVLGSKKEILSGARHIPVGSEFKRLLVWGVAHFNFNSLKVET